MLKLGPQDGETVVEVTPRMAGWEHLTFRVLRVAAGARLAWKNGEEEGVAVLLSGRGRLQGQEVSRPSVFQALPAFAYVPRRGSFVFEAEADSELAWGAAPCDQDFPARVLGPRDCAVEMRGGRNVTRQITHLVDPGFCQRLLVVEVYTPSGNWSSYPPHKHDADNLPLEVDLDEVYHYRMAPGGWAVQRLYDEDFDELFLCRDRDTVVVRRGYHPVVAAPGYDVYYLNFLAGRHPLWVVHDDPELAWVRGTWDAENPLALPLEP